MHHRLNPQLSVHFTTLECPPIMDYPVGDAQG